MAENQGLNSPRPENGERLERAARQMTAMSHFVRAATSLFMRGGVLIVLVVASGLLLSRAGRFLGPGTSGKAVPAAPLTVAAPEPIDWSRVDVLVVEAAAKARQHAEQYAQGELDIWTGQMCVRIDEDFLPWYFGYWNQQAIGLKACWQGVKYQLAGYVTDGATPSPAERMMQDIQAEFANRVLRPESAQLRLEQITRQAVDLYLADLRGVLRDIQVHYSISPAQWDRYLEGIAAGTQRVDGNRSVPLSLKAVAGSTTGATVLLTRALAKLAARVEARLATSAAEKQIARVAARAGTKVAAQAGGKMLGPIIAVGLIVWDVWDHRCTVSENQPILRGALVEYLSLMKGALLRDPQTGVLAAIHEIETGIVQSQAHDSPSRALVCQDNPG